MHTRSVLIETHADPRFRPWRTGRLRYALSAAWAAAFVWPGAALGTDRAPSGDIPHMRNPPQPVQGVLDHRLQEVWRAGDDEEVFFGVIEEAITDARGDVYLLDHQLACVWVFGADGTFQRRLSREGEGPGEVYRPRDIFFLPDSSLALLGRAPAKVTRLDRMGSPMSSLHLRRPEETGAGSMRARSGLWRGGTLVFCGQERRQVEGQRQQVRFLSIFGVDGVERHRLWHHDQQAWDFEQRSFTERYAYFVEQGRRWALDPEGNIYVARERDRYVIHVYGPGGALLRVIERDYEPVQRSPEDKQRVADGLTMTIGGEVVQLDAEIEDTEACLRELFIDEQGRLWVWHARSMVDQLEGVFATCDLFDPDGRYVAQVRLGVDADPLQDRLVPLGEDRYVLLRGIIPARDAMWGVAADVEEGAEVTPLEAVYLRREL